MHFWNQAYKMLKIRPTLDCMCIGQVDDSQSEGRGFDSRSSRHVKGPSASSLLTVTCALRRKTPIQYPCCSRERL